MFNPAPFLVPAILVGVVAAQSTTTLANILPELPTGVTIHGSVISAGPTAIALEIGCGDSEQCILGKKASVTVIQPNVHIVSMTYRPEETIIQSCTVIASGVDVCAVTAHYTEEEGGEPQTTSTTLTNSGALALNWVGPVTVTAGVEKLAATSSSAGVPRITQNALMVGVAAMVGGAALL